jgi:hypothetical protein
VCNIYITSQRTTSILRELAANLVREHVGSSEIADRICEAKLDGSQLANFPELYELIVNALESFNADSAESSAGVSVFVLLY